MKTSLTLTLLASLLPLAASATPPSSPEAESYGMQGPPAGVAGDDLVLWKKARDVDVRLPIERSVSTRLMARANGSRWDERIAEGSRRGSLDEARAAELRRRLLEQWDVVTIVLTAGWKVDPTRVCGYPLLDFDSALRVDEQARRARLLPEAKGRLSECVETATRILAELERANGGLLAALEAVEKETPALPPAAAATPKAASAAQPAQAIAAAE
jgi:hypothetical protein